MNAFDRKATFPSRQLNDAIMGHSRAHIFHLRRQCDHLRGVHGGHVGDAERRLMLLKLVLDLAGESIQRDNARATDDEHNEEGDQ